jgi:hypothetical protein
MLLIQGRTEAAHKKWFRKGENKNKKTKNKNKRRKKERKEDYLSTP